MATREIGISPELFPSAIATVQPTFDGMRELRAERNVGNRDIVKNEVEPSSTLHEVVSDESRNLTRTVSAMCRAYQGMGVSYIFSLGDQLTGVELGDDRLQDFIHDRGQHSLIVVGSKFSVAEKQA